MSATKSSPSGEEVAELEATAERELMRLIITCPDRPGIVAAVSRMLAEDGANIVVCDQFSTGPDNGTPGTFFLRIEFTIGAVPAATFAERFGYAIATPLRMQWRIWTARRPKRIAILASREDHCLQELLWRWRRDELGGEVVLVASNHDVNRRTVENFDLPYHHIPVEKDHKPQAEARFLEVLDGACDVVVLARYMQILSGDFLRQVGVPVINIHHSFLPAFVGANPYGRAKERGVKLIGATAHYVTEELDAGPIIEQDVIRVSHANDVEQLTRLGANVERTVLARAVHWHCEDRVLRHGNQTVVF